VAVKPKHSIGSFHRHWGNFAHKVRVYTYLQRLGKEGVRRMAAMSVLSSRYLLLEALGKSFPSLPAARPTACRACTSSSSAHRGGLQAHRGRRHPAQPASYARVGKLFLDFGFHAPTVAFPRSSA
jgi:glycine dehydrogenase